MQRDWDRLKSKARINLVVSGSINRMMEQIFSADQPLYGRATNEIDLSPFSTDSLKEILAFHASGYSNESLLALWAFTGGVAKYVELLMDQGACSLEGMVNAMTAAARGAAAAPVVRPVVCGCCSARAGALGVCGPVLRSCRSEPAATASPPAATASCASTG